MRTCYILYMGKEMNVDMPYTLYEPAHEPGHAV